MSGRAADGGSAIAIVGLGLRYPGGRGVQGFWDMLIEGRDAITEVPRSRFDADTVYDENPSPGRATTRWGGFLDGIDLFDADFFGISPAEARSMDPQQRMLLEVAYEALEDAGVAPDRLAGTPAGVFIGMMSGDYWEIQTSDPKGLDLYSLNGAHFRANAAGRLSYAFDLRGPAVTIDAACASSLVAVHTAVRSLRRGECSLALACGANLVLLPHDAVGYSQAGMMAADGRCKFADARGDGFVRSDGVGVVALRRLEDALADGDRIRAVILGSGVNNNGRSGGHLSAPSRTAQRDLLRSVYAEAGVDLSDVDFVEAHGTGTRVGDPAELGALGEVLGPGRDRPLLVGSVKTNIGHTEAAAGIAGLAKAVLALEHGVLPPSLHLTEPNPLIPWDEHPLEVPTEPVRLPDRGRPAVAGVDSFGINGTNAHVVLAAVPPAEAAAEPAAHGGESSAGRALLLPLSARRPSALRELAGAYLSLLSEEASAPRLLDLCHSAATRRQHDEARLAVVADSAEGMADAFRGHLDGTHTGAVRTADEAPAEPPGVVMVFPGQGGQWPGMGRELMETEPVFAASMAQCDEAIRAETGWSVIELLEDGDPERFGELDVVQPALWAMEVSLASLWRSWGVRPRAVIGHSMGEAAAAVVAGALTVPDAAAVICRRSRIAKRLAGHGAMGWVELPEADVQTALSGYGTRVSVAACNSPRSTVISGAPDAVDELLAGFEGRGVFCRRINVDFASHSPQMDDIADELLTVLSEVRPEPATVPILSTVTGETTDGSGMDAAYWADNIRRPVRFDTAVRRALEAAEGTSETVFIEVGPHPTVIPSIEETLREADGQGTAVASLRREEPERARMLDAAAVLYTAGARLAWDAVLGEGGRFTPLPAYPWQREPYWNSGSPSTAPALAPRPTHPLLGDGAAAPSGRVRWEAELDLGRNPFISGHLVQRTVVVPGTAYLEMAHQAASELLGDGPVEVGDVVYERALTPRPGDAGVIAAEAGASGDRRDFEVVGRGPGDDRWERHMAARLSMPPGRPDGTLPVDRLRSALSERVASADFYTAASERGNQWEGDCRGVAELWLGPGEALARISAPERVAAELDGHRFHPALLDACLQPVSALLPDALPGQEHAWFLKGAERVRFYRRPGTALWSHLVMREGGDRVDVRIAAEDGTLVADVRGMEIRFLNGARSGSGGARDWFYELRWSPAPRREPAPPAEPGSWLVLAGTGPEGGQVAEALKRAGHSASVLVPDGARGTDRAIEEAAGRGPWRGVVYLRALDAPGIDSDEPGAADRAESLTGAGVHGLVRALAAHPLPGGPGLWLVTRGAQSAGNPGADPFQAQLWGMGRSLAQEDGALGVRLVDLDPRGGGIEALVEEMTAPGREDQLCLRSGEWLSARLVPCDRAAAGTERPRALVADSAVRAVAGTARERVAPASDQVEIAVDYAGLNFLDVLRTLGTSFGGEGEAESVLGLECAGTVVRTGTEVYGLEVGQRVAAIAPGAMSTHVTVSADLVRAYPAHLSAAEAATLPVSYVTVYRALCEVAQVRAGETVVVHGATGGTGLAAMQVARWRGARVLATAGSEEKRELLRFLGAAAVADSRSLDFVEEFRRATGGRGADIVLNTLAGEALEANLSLLAPYGRHVELGKRDISEGERIGLHDFQRQLSFHAVDVRRMVVEDPERAGALLERVLELVGDGVLGPLPYRAFPAERAREAFDLMKRARHRGKIVFGMSGHPVADAERAGAGLAVRADATYLITGGAGDLGRALAIRLVDRGARHLLLIGRSAPAPGSAAAGDLDALRRRGARIEFARADCADEERLRSLLERRAAEGLPPVRGAVHAAGVLEPAPLAELTDEEFAAATRAKVRGGRALHRVLAGADLDFFVLYSSASAVIDSPLMAAYAAGNAFLDALAHDRRAAGLAATTVGWGFWEGAGMAHRVAERQERTIMPQGVEGFGLREGLEVLERLVADGAVQTVVMPTDWQEWARAHPGPAARPVFDVVARRGTAEPAPVPAPREPAAPGAAVPEAGPSRGGELRDYLQEQVAGVLGVRADQVGFKRPLNRIGLDSLMAVELRNNIRRDLGVTVPVVKMVGSGTLADVASAIAEQRDGAEESAAE
ncbi:acyl transferase domain-containing protein/acyl carrier protein [Spinactinospora alkalitolerans]|uniref:Acyl transferase domain-containing protein/acyl carrier protein n=1 Tax=Spinactinospora alkalitolerans TaxID=687207 RepID=A0A852TNA4_9ACTN|nr:type I polyketide synthase [Spinactinospora alkalitolerans]NYE45418.1 acyl transferase domain-containing protein/acyl carrier protein [Spinactinospora alkalitolerans]